MNELTFQEKQEKLNDRLDLSSYLLNPIQRLGRYILLLENLKKSLTTAKCETLTEAIQFLKKTMKRGNDYVALDSIARCPKNIDFSTTGSFILREKFNMLKPRKGERMLFLFDKIIILTVADQVNTPNMRLFCTFYWCAFVFRKIRRSSSTERV